MIKTIELDCAPGAVRPGALIGGVVKDTALEEHLGKPVSSFFGNWIYAFPNVSNEDWLEAKKTIGPRVNALHEQGLIRYGSW